MNPILVAQQNDMRDVYDYDVTQLTKKEKTRFMK